MLLLADRGFYGFELWQQARASGADLLWRVKKNAALPVVRVLDDGSYLSAIHAEQDRKARRPGRRAGRGVHPGPAGGHRLPPDHHPSGPEQAPAAELAALYAQRWEIETTLDEVKTHQRGPGSSCAPSTRGRRAGGLRPPARPLRDPAV